MCRDGNVNYFNPIILVFCCHNHDIKCILSGKAAKAAMFYITDYITKMDLKTYEMLSLLSRAVSQMPEVTPGSSVVNNAKKLLHKCFSQFTKQQQIHAQQAARYIRGFGDGIPSHQTVPMLSGLLMAYVNETFVRDHTQFEDSLVDDDTEEYVEEIQLRIATDRQGNLVETNQIHHYIHRADSLTDMCFFKFCRCICLQSKSRSANVANTSSTCLGVLNRYSLKPEHPLHETHELVEHTNEEVGIRHQEFVPRVVGMSIPRKGEKESNTRWFLFVLAHFKPFSATRPLLSNTKTVEEVFKHFTFGDRHLRIIENWEAVYECQDERDAERLRKRAALTAESRAKTSEFKTIVGDDDEAAAIDASNPPPKNSEADFQHQQTVLLLQQSRWLGSGITTSMTTPGNLNGHNGPIVNEVAKELLPEITQPLLKKWARDVKEQETYIFNARRNALDPNNQTAHNSIVRESETINSIVWENLRNVEPYTEAKNQASSTDKLPLTPAQVIEKIGTEFNLNEKQWVAFRIIAEHYVNKYVLNVEDVAPLTMMMTGPGGTGKTHVVRAVRAVMAYYGCEHKIRFLAPTGSAAVLIDGMTVHKGLGIKMTSSNKGKGKGKGNRLPGESLEDYTVLISVRNRNELRQEWRNIDILLIDEVSLLSLQLLAEIDHALRYAKERPNEWFGGVTVIFAGDFYQYPPVGGSPLYSPISVYAGQTDAEISKRLGRLAWKTVDTVVMLTEQQRMKNDPEYGAAVQRLRTRECTFEDAELFNSRLIKSAANPDGIDMGTVENFNAAAIVATNTLRELLNSKKARAVCALSVSNLIVCATLDKTASAAVQDIETREYLLRLNVTTLNNSLPGFISLFVGMPVILRSRNLSTDLGITNGSQGFVRKISTKVCPAGFTYCTSVIVEFPESKVHLDNLPKGFFPVTPISWTFTTLLVNKDGSKEKIRVTRQQLPVQPAFAVTGHSSQGKTLPKVIVNLHEGGFGAYVAASRARDRNGLCITSPVLVQQLNTPIRNDLRHEIRRLDCIEHNTYVCHGVLKGELKNVPDSESETHTGMASAPKANFIEDNSGNRLSHKRKGVLPRNTLEGERPNKKIRGVSYGTDTSDVVHRTIPPVDMAAPAQMIPSGYDQAPTIFSNSDDISLSPTAGCTWSSTNWSCAYDSVFMLLFSVYRSFDEIWKRAWHTLSPFHNMLGDMFDVLMYSPDNMMSSQLFDFSRDNLRNFLHQRNADRFPRTGQVGTAASNIFEELDESRQLCLTGVCVGQCHDDGNTQSSTAELTACLPTICFPIHGPEQCKAPTDLQEYIDNFFILKLQRLAREGRICSTCGLTLKLVLHLQSQPSMICFEVPGDMYSSLLPVSNLLIPQLNCSKCYELRGVLYLGDFHFTARIMETDGTVWTDDGNKNHGRPVADNSCSHLVSEGKLDCLMYQGSSKAHIYIYSLASPGSRSE